MRLLRILFLALICALVTTPAFSPILRGGGSSSNFTINRIFLVLYGQSNMGTMISGNGSPTNPPPSPVAGTSTVQNGVNIGPPSGNGLTTLQNAVTTATRLPSISIQCEVGGSGIAGFTKGAGTGIYEACIGFINSFLTVQDQVFILWDQGEGDANVVGDGEVPDFYAPTMVQIHKDMVADIGRTTTNAPWITSAKGSDSGISGDASGGQTPQKWQSVKNAQVWTPFYESSGGMRIGFTDMDFDRTDSYHYVPTSSAKQGARYAQAINTAMGVASPAGLAVFNTAGASIIDATHTSVAVTHTLGTDFGTIPSTPAFEISCNNGASWSSPSAAARLDATHLSLTHSSCTTTNARLVRYAWGNAPPNVDNNCGSDDDPPGSGVGPCATSTLLVSDNSALSVPLTPTTWDLRATGGTTLPMPTWRDTNTCSSPPLPNCANLMTQTVSGLQLGPEQVQKFVIVSLVGIDLSGTPATHLTVQPQDFFGNNVGSSITVPATPIDRSGTNALFAFSTNGNNAAATTFSITLTVNATPFGNATWQAWTVPLAELTSTTPTGHNHATATSAKTVSTTLNTSAGGFTVCIAANSVGANRDTFTGSITGTTLTASVLPSTKTLDLGQIISAPGGPGSPVPGTTIRAVLTSTTFTVTPSYSTPIASQTLTNGTGFPTATSTSGETPAVRWGSSSVGFDAANSAGSASANETFNSTDTGNLDLVCAAWR